MNCCDYQCTRALNCPAGSVDAWTKANIKSEFDANVMLAQTKPQIEMFEPSGFLTTMEWLKNTIAPCLISVAIGGFIASVYFLTRG